MKFALVLCIAALGSPSFQAHGHHHHHHHHSEHNPYSIAQVYSPQESIAVVRPTIRHEYFKNHHGSHHMKDNIGATIHTSYCGTAFEPNQEGHPECMGSYSGSNVFVQPAVGQYNQFALKCKAILQSLLDFISKPVEFGCTPGSALNLDLKSRIVNHKLPCETICLTEEGMVPVLEDKVVEVPVPISTSDCAPEVYPMEVRPQVSECSPCNTQPVQSVQMVPVEVTPVHEPVHHVHLEPAIVPTHHVVYEQPIMKAELIPEVYEEHPKETKHQIHELQKQLHHMYHNQKKHHHHHHHH